ncbi:peroxide stress protein YaaA [Helicobacter sp. MIT 05-5293]|uniref:peroxide stress protein YaaA n=1 Tax=Helicobacter sp. MIT 05-5293 TaxID=1548149 RepID=UPI00051D9D97|nr:peroxide stress protein YaaA [Helicobacter sp. MIT 05-5293]TLD82090.1 peroxide stress protein YaaA [Helicobacter sp. MIT 05-5293]
MDLKILFSPSEGKIYPLYQEKDNSSLFDLSFVSDKALKAYMTMLQNASEEKICAVLGSKKIDLEELSLLQNLYNAPRIESIRLYNGVAYKALGFEELDSKTKDYLYKHVYIFSNLFGVLRAKECVPYYNVHQGKGFGDFGLKKIYQDTKVLLDKEFSQGMVLDLRAEAYIKAYPICEKSASDYYQIVFLKNGKKVSHYAKWYRGVYLRTLAIHHISNLGELLALDIPHLSYRGEKITQNATILTYDVQE